MAAQTAAAVLCACMAQLACPAIPGFCLAAALPRTSAILAAHSHCRRSPAPPASACCAGGPGQFLGLAGTDKGLTLSLRSLRQFVTHYKDYSVCRVSEKVKTK